MEDPIINKYILNNLNYWKYINKNEDSLIKIINKYKLKVCKIILKNGTVHIEKLYNSIQTAKLNKAITFLSDIVKMYSNLDTYIYLYIQDTLCYEKINIYNINGNLDNSRNSDNFIWGVSTSNKDYIRIVDSKKIAEYNESFPIFCFERNREMAGVLFPTFGADNNNFKVSQNIDKFIWDEKTIDKSIFRGKNICCDIPYLDKVKLINFSNRHPKETDFKFSSNRSHSNMGKIYGK